MISLSSPMANPGISTTEFYRLLLSNSINLSFVISAVIVSWFTYFTTRSPSAASQARFLARLIGIPLGIYVCAIIVTLVSDIKIYLPAKLGAVATKIESFEAFNVPPICTAKDLYTQIYDLYSLDKAAGYIVTHDAVAAGDSIIDLHHSVLLILLSGTDTLLRRRTGYDADVLAGIGLRSRYMDAVIQSLSASNDIRSLHFARVLVAGHSLGGITAEELLLRMNRPDLPQLLDDKLGLSFSNAVTFGAPIVEPRLPRSLNPLNRDDLQTYRDSATEFMVGYSSLPRGAGIVRFAINSDPIPKLITGPRFWQLASQVKSDFVTLEYRPAGIRLDDHNAYQKLDELSHFDAFGDRIEDTPLTLSKRCLIPQGRMYPII
jgi:pimeloyl-ACP methyl ester carboxylesterase